MDNKSQLTYGLIVGNRGFFPAHLCETGRKQLIDVLEKRGHQVICLSPEETTFGSLESLVDAQKCAALFSKHRADIDGIIVTLPNFGDERGVANAIRWSELDVPILVHAFPDRSEKLQISDRRDAFCGKISVCNNLHQYGIKFSLTSRHVMDPASKDFQQELDRFGGICRVYRAFKNLRVGIIGARPAAFNTVRFSEKILERSGISVEPIDLSEIIFRAEKQEDDHPAVLEKLAAIQSYLPHEQLPASALLKMAKLSLVIETWMEDQSLSAVALQCWTALEEIYGVVPCTLMSMLSNGLVPAACETDIMGVISMYALSAASVRPSAIVDFNNNFGDEEDKCVLFHCSNLPKDLLLEEKASGGNSPVISYHDILAGALGKENSWGIVAGEFAPGPYTFCRLSSNDFSGTLSGYLGEGAVTKDRPSTFGGYGVMEIKGLQGLLKFICKNGYEHHVSIAPGHTADVLKETFSNYLGWQIFHHR
jgi:L-fucose isomerase-like protein